MHGHVLIFLKEDMEKVKALGFETEGKSKNLKI